MRCFEDGAAGIARKSRRYDYLSLSFLSTPADRDWHGISRKRLKRGVSVVRYNTAMTSDVTNEQLIFGYIVYT